MRWPEGGRPAERSLRHADGSASTARVVTPEAAWAQISQRAIGPADANRIYSTAANSSNSRGHESALEDLPMSLLRRHASVPATVLTVAMIVFTLMSGGPSAQRIASEFEQVPREFGAA